MVGIGVTLCRLLNVEDGIEEPKIFLRRVLFSLSIFSFQIVGREGARREKWGNFVLVKKGL